MRIVWVLLGKGVRDRRPTWARRKALTGCRNIERVTYRGTVWQKRRKVKGNYQYKYHRHLGVPVARSERTPYRRAARCE